MMRFLTCSLALFLAVGFSIGEEAPDPAEATKESFYLIGNSLTWDTVPQRLDGDVQWHVDCGKSLPFMYENPGKPCVKSSTLWPEALKAKPYDVISIQVHYGSTLIEDAAVISTLIEMQPTARIVIHTGWARSESREEEYTGGYSVDDPGALLTHSPEYFRALLRSLREAHPDRDFRLTHAQDLLQRVAKDIEEGKAPFEAIEDVYRDAIHMDRVTGRYLMHNAMRKALGQPASVQGFEKIGEKEKAYFDGLLSEYEVIAREFDPGRKSP